MKLNPTSRNLIGKLFFFELPIFRIGNIVRHIGGFTQILEKNSNLIFSEPVIEEKNPSRILGKDSNSIKYNFVGFEEENNFIEKFEIGIGENGYYYDMFLKPKSEINDNESTNYDRRKILSAVEFIEKNLFNLFSKCTPEFVRKSFMKKPMEISNVIFYVEFAENIQSLFNNKLNTAINSAVKKSESIVPGISNNFGRLISFNIYPNPDEHAGIDMDKIIIPERIITIRQEPIHNKNLYYIRFRGIPAEETLNFLESISKIVET